VTQCPHTGLAGDTNAATGTAVDAKLLYRNNHTCHPTAGTRVGHRDSVLDDIPAITRDEISRSRVLSRGKVVSLSPLNQRCGVNAPSAGELGSELPPPVHPHTQTKTPPSSE